VKNILTTTIGAGAVALTLLVVALPAYGGTFQLYTISGFVDTLIERGIIPENMATKARELAAVVRVVDDVRMPDVPDQEHLDVSVSQLIQYASRTYEEGEDVRGLVLLATNTHTEDVYPSARRGCQVVYRIYKDDVLEYDSATRNACATDEEVTYRLAPGQTRMFEVSHPALAHPLSSGTYRIVLEYPGYGSGEREITVE
jgi:hypothetical protein